MALRRTRLAGALAATAVALVSTTANAQVVPSGTGYAADNLNPAERGSDFFSAESLDLRGHGRLAFGILVGNAYRTVADRRTDGGVNASPVRNQAFLYPGATITLFDRVRIAFSVPVAFYSDGNQASMQVSPIDPNTGTRTGSTLGTYAAPTPGGNVGDVRIGTDVRVYGKYGEPVTVALGVQAFVPSGSPDAYTGDGNPRLHPRLSVAGQMGLFQYAAQVGGHFRFRDDLAYGRDYGNGGRVGHEFTFQIAAGLRLANGRVTVGPELYGRKSAQDTDGQSSPVEALLGGHFGITENVRLSAGVGAGITKSYGAPVVRGIFGLEWVLDNPAAPAPADEDKDGIIDSIDACPKVAGVASTEKDKNGCPAVVLDRDGDGMTDDVDACPDTIGMRSGEPTKNGCLPDRDKDGIPDTQDACGDVPGTANPEQLKNGCPPDKDGDGVTDTEDACPEKAGPHRDDPKKSGCPDEDSDKDGVLDDVDACPNDAGTPSADPKANGCPTAVMKGDEIQIHHQIQFKTGSAEILKNAENDALIAAVVEVMKAHPELKAIRVEGHTDNVGNAPANKKLSEARAESVKKALVAKGVAKERLTSAGLGSEKPLDPADTEAARSKNRRVEFHVQGAAK